MSGEQLPVDLEHAIWYCAHASLSGFTPDDDARKASDAIRAEHNQRLTLQHHACDQAQRIADLERHAANLVSESEAKITAMQEAFEERLTLDRANRLLVKRIADLETKCDTLKELHDAAADERDALRARLAEIEAQEPVGWQQRTLFDGQWSDWQDCNRRTASILRQREDYEVRVVYARPVPALIDRVRRGDW